MTGPTDLASAIIWLAVGALLSFVLSAFSDRTRWRRDAAIRWDPQRIAVYADYATAVREMYEVVLAAATLHGYCEGCPRPIVDPDSALREAEGHRAARFEVVLLVGDERTVDAARRWHQSVWHLECFARGRSTGAAGWAAARREFGVARAEYYRAARQHLGIPGGLPHTRTPVWKAALMPPSEAQSAPPQ